MTTPQTCAIDKAETILLATDGTPFSEGAIREAIGFASNCSSRLHAVFVTVSNPEYETIGAAAYEKEEAQALAHLQTVKARAGEANVTCEAVLVSAMDAAQALVEEAATRKADLIVIGRHGYKGLAKALMGEVAAKVIGHTSCKVLVVPKEARISYKKILVATDGSAHAMAAVAEAITIAQRRGSHLIALSAMRDESERAEATALANKAAEMAKAQGVSAEAVTPTGRSFNAIVETAGGRGVDLIVIGTYGKSGMKKLLMGSSTEKVIGNAGCAVLVVQAKA